MKCSVLNATKRDNTMKKVSGAPDDSIIRLKMSPVKDNSPTKPQSSSKEISKVFSAKNNKESNNSRDPVILDNCFEDSGYLSLHNSHIDPNVEGENNRTPGKLTTVHQEKTISSKKSSKSQGKAKVSRPLFLEAATTPVVRLKPKTTRALSSTPSNNCSPSNLPILKFQQDVCEALSRSFKKNKKYDFSIIKDVADKHNLDRVIGRQMGLEYVDVFSSLLSMNMRIILGNILALLGDLDLISCKKVSKTWKKIICEQKEAFSRCQQAEEKLMESSSALTQLTCGLTRDVSESRVVLSCMQAVASSSAPSSSDQSCRAVRRTAASLKSSTPVPQCSRHNEFVQTASRLKRHQCQYKCRRCGSPATDMHEEQRATCTRSSCLFDFCTHCQETFHGSTPCRTVQPKSHFTANTESSTPSGSARSKRSLKRL
ncbi:F-box only protein 5 [Austrofundulus limnaeus]|uniref:F-box only protein 5 n=1 Tax=Austrofundulus limnaeus TaxID=52670 RepID=A0A2I4AYS3_AUSLI|nr:PREDICTED: F-box only protein 5 [Austrofundulus limnaeus]